jgi:hypothetical protein
MIGAGIQDADPDPEEGDGSPSPELGGHGGKKRGNTRKVMTLRGRPASSCNRGHAFRARAVMCARDRRTLT